MPAKKILCKPCGNPLGTFEDNKIIFKSMKAISQIETDTKTGNSDIKCHYCHNWNSIDKDGNVTINEKKKGQEHLYAFSRK